MQFVAQSLHRRATPTGMCIEAIRGTLTEDTELLQLVSCILQLHETGAFVRCMRERERERETMCALRVNVAETVQQ